MVMNAVNNNNGVPGITPQMNSTKFAAIEMLNKRNLMRPTSSRVGNFLSSDKPESTTAAERLEREKM